MAEYTRDHEDDFVDFTTDDNWVQLIWDAAVKLAGDADPFGDVYSRWTTMDGTEIFSQWPLRKSATITEVGGILNIDDNGSLLPWSIGARRGVTYEDADVVLYWSYTHPAIGVASLYLTLWRDEGDFVDIGLNHNTRKVATYKFVGGTPTLLAITADLGSQADVWFRITRVASTKMYQFWYALADPIATPTNWVSLWGPAEIADFGVSDLFYPLANVYCNRTNFNPDVDFYDQIVGSEERFCLDSPECNIIDHSAGTVEFCLDAGLGSTWDLSAFSAVDTGDGGSVKFRAAYGDAPDREFATWIQGGAWLTEAELNTNINDLDGHRYVFLQAQFNSDGTQRPTLMSVTFTGVPVVLVPEFELIRVEIEVPKVQVEVSPELRAEVEVPKITVPIKW